MGGVRRTGYPPGSGRGPRAAAAAARTAARPLPPPACKESAACGRGGDGRW